MMAEKSLLTNKSPEFSPQPAFSQKLDITINKLSLLENNWSADKQTDFKKVKQQLIQELDLDKINKDERQLFNGIFKLFVLKSGLGPNNGTLLERLNQSHEGKMIGFLGPLGVSKTTLARNLAEGLEVDLATVEPHEKNPFWRAMQKESKENYPKYMLRSQIYFFISNINSDIRARLSPNLTISDTSNLTDILMWARWYNKTGKFDNKEYETYQKLVDLLRPIIPKPDLLVVLKPDTVDHLKQGIVERQANERSRTGELNFAKPNNNDLLYQVKSIDDIAKDLEKKWQVKTLKFNVNPLDIYKKTEACYDINYKIMSKLNLLGNLIRPRPDEVAKKAFEIISSINEGQVIIVHSKSMFSGKTTAVCKFAEMVGLENVLTFQPRKSLRLDQKGFEDQETTIISRNHLKIPAHTTDGNDLKEIKEFIIANKIKPAQAPYILIDEIMFFIDQGDKPQEAIQVLEDLRKMGFQVIVDGIDFTFNNRPFTFMLDLLTETKTNKNWHQLETSTKCHYCGELAQGTELSLVDENGKKYRAPSIYNWDYPGDTEYTPVCVTTHPSCSD